MNRVPLSQDAYAVAEAGLVATGAVCTRLAAGAVMACFAPVVVGLALLI